VNYSSFACKRITNEGYCPIAAMKNLKLAECHDRVLGLLADRLGDLDDASKERVVKTLSYLIINGSIARACGLDFQIKFDEEAIDSFKKGATVKNKKYVSHPVKAYFDEVLKIKNPKKEEDAK